MVFNLDCRRTVYQWLHAEAEAGFVCGRGGLFSVFSRLLSGLLITYNVRNEPVTSGWAVRGTLRVRILPIRPLWRLATDRVQRSWL